jgi:undecaprenyl diphosphate synthase
MDGNGRWATRRGLPRAAGHRAGVAAARRVVERARDLGIRCLTLYAFSSDNWRRPAAEVETIFWLLRAFLRLETQRLRDRGVRLQAIGRRDRIPPPLLKEILRAESLTAHGHCLHLRVAIDYSSRESIAQAALFALASNPNNSVNSANSLTGSPTDLMICCFADSVTRFLPPVDLLIRTGGEQRLSDFLLWESAYAELLFTPRMWPDFDASDLDAALADFAHRTRRFGALPGVAANRQPELVQIRDGAATL